MIKVISLMALVNVVPIMGFAFLGNMAEACMGGDLATLADSRFSSEFSKVYKVGFMDGGKDKSSIVRFEPKNGHEGALASNIWLEQDPSNIQLIKICTANFERGKLIPNPAVCQDVSAEHKPNKILDENGFVIGTVNYKLQAGVNGLSDGHVASVTILDSTKSGVALKLKSEVNRVSIPGQAPDFRAKFDFEILKVDDARIDKNTWIHSLELKLSIMQLVNSHKMNCSDTSLEFLKEEGERPVYMMNKPAAGAL